MTISVRLYCIHFRKDIGKSIHLYSVHVAGVQQLDVLNLIKIVFNKDPRLHNATRSIQSIFQDGSADPEPKHLGDLLTTDDARTVLDVETSSNMVWSIAVVHRTFHPEKDGFDGRLRWIENGWQDSVTVFDRLDWNTYVWDAGNCRHRFWCILDILDTESLRLQICDILLWKEADWTMYLWAKDVCVLVMILWRQTRQSTAWRMLTAFWTLKACARFARAKPRTMMSLFKLRRSKVP